MQLSRSSFPCPRFATWFVAVACLASLALGDEDRWTAELTYPELVRKAQAGSPYFQGLLGIYLRSGEMGIKINYRLAKQWSEATARAGHPFGLYNLANLATLENDLPRAREYYQDAQLRLERKASDGDPVALYCMGEIDFVLEPTNVRRAVHRFEQAARAGYPAAQATFGSLCMKGFNVPRDVRRGMQLLLQAAQSNSLTARFNLGMAHYSGDGVPRDLTKAVRWFRLAANQNFDQGQYILGMLLLEEDGIYHDKTEGLRLLELAASQGHPDATEALRSLGQTGTQSPSPISTPLAKPVGNPAPTGGLTVAQHLSEARRHYLGSGAPQDYAKAFGHFRVAAEQGAPVACRYLGLMLLSGKGCEKNPKAAETWLRKASEGGDTQATRALVTYRSLFR